ncbi:nicotinate-nucleotide--dimethylbenzimidazole phosphoribosyltransferase [Streptomyces sp. NPDC048595]|uniref:nicotinate-nucleotide--dimethylbenzimidazole phosphoribosyltransferase n=1 Tax=Streptomyces sp. NPDC048595 TaxID=3365576 RepID=UPI0037187DBB
MTDTGQVPGEGLPENAGGHPGQPQPAAAPSPADPGPTELPGMVTPPGEYPYLDQADGVVEDDDLLLMPGAQGAWSEQPAPLPQETHQGAAPQPQHAAPFDAAAQPAAGFEPMPAQAGDHESGGRDSGAVDLSAVRIPQPAAPPQPDRARATASPRRPLHMGPPVPDATGGVVRSLADRGPAETPAAQSPAPPVGVPTGGPEYFDAPAEAPEAAPGEQPAPGQAYAAQPVGEPAPGQPFAVPPHGEQPYGDRPGAAPSYGGQLSAEQTYGAAGQGPLPGPQLGEIPSQVPQWGEAPAQAVAAPAAEPAVPAEAAVPGAETVQPVAQDVPPPAGQSQPAPMASPAEDGAPAGEAAVVVDAAGAGGAEADAVQAAPVQAPGAPQEVATAPVPDAVPQGQDGPVATEAVAADAVAADAVAVDEAAADAAAPDAPAPDAPVQEAPAQEAPVAAQQPEAVAAEGEPQPEDQQQPAAEGPEVAPTAAEAVAVPVEVVPAAQPVAEQPPAPEADAPQTAPDAPQAADQPQPEQPAAPTAEVPPQPEAAPADEPAAAPVAAPQGPVALPLAEGAAPVEQPTAIEPPQAQQPADAQPQPVAPVDPAAQQPTEAPAPEAEPQGADAPAGQQPAAAVADTPDDSAEAGAATEPAAPIEADGSAEATVTDADADAATTAEPAAPAGPTPPDAPADPQPVIVHIPAQASGDQPLAQVAAPATADAPAAPAADDQPAAAALAQPEATGDEAPRPQDAAALVQLGEDQDDEQPQTAEAEQFAAADGVPAAAPAAGYDDSERAAVHRVMRERRDIRNGFRGDPIPNEVLLRVLEAAHTAPSVGHSQPWDFVVIRSAETREKMHQLAMEQREAYAKSLPKARAKQFRELKIEAILETPVNIVVTADSTRGGRHTLGRHTQPQMAPYSSALAVENLWLAARAEGLGVGWVSFFDEREMVRELGLPEHLEVVAYLCVGYVDEFPEEPELLQAGWSKRRPLSWVVHEETYGRRALPGENPHDLLQETLQGIRPLDAKALGEAWERQKRMTKPAGALGMLEIISAQLCGLSRKCPPPIPEPAAVAIFAGDHGVHAQGVTPWPQEVTGQMVANFLGGGAVCNAFANQVGAEVCVVDVGVAGELPATPGLLPRKVRAGTADFTAGPAMTQDEVLKAIEVGIETARDLVAAGNKALLTGEMGIANTTTSAALIAVYTGVDPVEVTGRGTGINDETHARKVDVVRRALELHQPDPADPIGVLAAIGGLEHAAMVGLILGGASLRTPVILDGVSAGAAALVARAIAPEALAACIAGHRSAEPGHVAALNKLGLRPLVDLDLRLGEGTGALLALPVVQSAARAMHEVATFDSAGVTEKS